MAPHPRPTGAPSMGGIFNNSNSTHPHPYPLSIPGPFNGLPGGTFWARNLLARRNDGGASGALILAIIIPSFFVIFGLGAILWQALKVRKVSIARRNAPRAARGTARSRRSRSGRSSRSHTIGGTDGTTDSNQFDSDHDSVSLPGPSRAYTGSSPRSVSDRSTVSDDRSSAPLTSPQSPPSSLNKSVWYRVAERVVVAPRR